MRKRVLSLIAIVLLYVMAMPAMSAPLFPDVPDNHWAKDAVAALAAKGLVEGYPDGLFKGDRAATRWEVAMVVARLLAKMEQAHATFATKAELEELRKLVNALREELDALGVRVTNLEENVSRIDKRVTELERITFYGTVDTRLTMQSFSNSGNNDNDANRFGGGNATFVPYVNYNAAVGTVVGGVGLFPQVFGVLPVIDFRSGRGLSNGTGFTMKGVLGLRIRITEDLDAGAEFAAFTSQGDAFVDAWWGVTAPYLSNVWTGNQSVIGNGVNGIGNQPFTKMTLDNFWVLHHPSHTKLILGAYSEDNLDDVIFAGQPNATAFGPYYLDRYGFNVSGKLDIEDTGVLRWEALGSRMGDYDSFAFPAVGAGAGNLENFLVGADLEFEFEGGNVKANFARVANEPGNGGVNAVGTIALINTSSGLGINGFTPLQWVNPPGHFAAQRSLFEQAATLVTGIGTTVDTRPISGWFGAGDAGFGNFGPQAQNMYGISADYKWDIGDGDTQIYVGGEYAHSDYRPNRNSTYSSDGDAARVEIGANLLEGDLDLQLEYLTVDPTYDPFILRYPGGFGYARLPFIHQFPGFYSIHDTAVYPHNREGFRLEGQWRFLERRGLVWAKFGGLDQKETSLYDVRVLGGGVANGPPRIPTQTVIGFSPGFIDPVFSGYAHPNIYGAGTANSFQENLAPLEDNRGDITNYGIGVTYKFDDPRVKLDLGYEFYNYDRPSSLSPGVGGSQNHVDLDVGSLHGEVAWEVDDQWTVHGGADWTNISGHYDPAGRYNQFAINTGNTTFQNLDSDQLSPFVGFDYDVSANTQWNLDFRYYDTGDNATVPINPATDSIGNTAHPFEWNGWQVTTQFKVKF